MGRGKIIIEETPGQKFNDIKKYDIDIFTVGSDWTGSFDYLNDYLVLSKRFPAISPSRNFPSGLIAFSRQAYCSHSEISPSCMLGDCTMSKYSDFMEKKTCKVITYGTFDLFHEGHYRLLQPCTLIPLTSLVSGMNLFAILPVPMIPIL